MKVLARCAVAMAALAGIGTVSGCNSSPGAAAVVGGDRISAATLQAAVNSALADPQVDRAFGAKRVSLTQTELSRLISNRVVARAAAQRHLTVSSEEVTAQVQRFAQQTGGVTALYQQAASQGGIPKNAFRSVIYYYTLEQKLGDTLVANVPVSKAQLQAAYLQNADQYEEVHAAHIQVATKKLADSILAQVRRDPTRFAALAARYSQDTTTKTRGGDLGFAPRSQFAQVKTLGDAVFAARPGSFLEVHTQLGWHVVHVIAHKHVSLAQATPSLKASLLQGQRQQLLNKLLAALATRLHIHVNPRYGRWDPKQQQVVPLNPSAGVSSPSPPAG